MSRNILAYQHTLGVIEQHIPLTDAQSLWIKQHCSETPEELIRLIRSLKQIHLSIPPDDFILLLKHDQYNDIQQTLHGLAAVNFDPSELKIDLWQAIKSHRNRVGLTQFIKEVARFPTTCQIILLTFFDNPLCCGRPSHLQFVLSSVTSDDEALEIVNRKRHPEQPRFADDNPFRRKKRKRETSQHPAFSSPKPP